MLSLLGGDEVKIARVDCTLRVKLAARTLTAERVSIQYAPSSQLRGDG